jgi:pimeloyl-ACP methyl ester carboxylesterase
MSRARWIWLVAITVLVAAAYGSAQVFKAPEIVLPPAKPLTASPEELEVLPGYESGPLHMERSGELVLTHADERTTSIRVFYPNQYPPFPVIVFSPGFGSGKDQYDAVIEHWVSFGYIVVATDHADSGGTVSAIMASIDLGEMGLIKSRVQDVTLVMNSLETVDGGKIHELGNLKQVVAAGHSFGALIAQMMAGAVAVSEEGEVAAYQGPPVEAVVALSPPGEMFDVIKAESWSNMRGPALMTTGTWDVDARFWTDWTAHLLSFENAKAGEQYALVVDGADHYLGNLICRLDRNEPPQHDALAMVNTVTAAFLNAYIRQDPDSQRLLKNKSLEEVTGNYAQLRRR